MHQLVVVHPVKVPLATGVARWRQDRLPLYHIPHSNHSVVILTEHGEALASWRVAVDTLLLTRAPHHHVLCWQAAAQAFGGDSDSDSGIGDEEPLPLPPVFVHPDGIAGEERDELQKQTRHLVWHPGPLFSFA
jgi:hypothetical protein